MKYITRDDLTNVVRNVGLAAERAGRIIGALEVSLARQAVRTEEGSFLLDQTTLSELEESLRIGAGISASEAKLVLAEVESALKSAEGATVKFLEEGTFEVAGGAVKFRLVEDR